MDKNNVVSAEIVRQITRMVVEELQKQQATLFAMSIWTGRTWTPCLVRAAS